MNHEFRILFQKYIDKTISEEELPVFYDYIQQSDDDAAILGLLTEFADYIDLNEVSASKLFSEEIIKKLQKKNQQLQAGLKSGEDRQQVIESVIKEIDEAYKQSEPVRKKQSLWAQFKKLFVMVFIILAAGTWYYVSKRGGATATEQVAYVKKTSEYGQKSTIPLPDGSVVKLNAGSKLIFPKLFEGDTREVTLEGEAFFEVARNENKPFVVRSGDLVTTVLGTSFNVKAYPEDPEIAVAVATGKVKVETVSSGGEAKPQFLTPNMVASYNLTAQKINISSYNNISNLLAWREGVLQFDAVPFTEVASTLERWYGVTVTLENENIGQCLIVGTFKNKSLARVMQVLKHAIDIEYQLTTNGLTVRGNGCPN